MASTRLTDRIVKALPAPAAGYRITFDAEVKGFGVRVTATGSKAFILQYRAAGRERRLTIGAWPAWDVARARGAAKRTRRDVDLGADPLGEREAEQAAPTVADLIERYELEHLPTKRPRSADEDRAMSRLHVLPAIGKMKVADVTHADIKRLHRSITAAGKATRANRVVALLSKAFALAVREWSWRSTNPCNGVKRNGENKRERYLSAVEIQRLMLALDQHQDRQGANAIRLLLLTGARRNEILMMRWSDLDLERGVWTKPSAHVKAKKAHVVPLAADAVALLAGMKSAADNQVVVSPWVFPGRGDPRRPQRDIKNVWRVVRREAGLEGVRLHDLRHSYASLLVNAGLSLSVIGALLGHSQTQTTARYTHLYEKTLRDATEKVATAVGSRTPVEVVPLLKVSKTN